MTYESIDLYLLSHYIIYLRIKVCCQNIDYHDEIKRKIEKMNGDGKIMKNGIGNDEMNGIGKMKKNGIGKNKKSLDFTK